MRVLYVCTANICRSVSAAQLLRAAAEDSSGLADLEIRSAGTGALPGMPGCSAAPALAGTFEAHRSQELTLELVDWSDLILTASRDHRSVVAVLDPPSRPRTFTIRQAGRISQWLLDSGMVEAAADRAHIGDAGWVERFEPGDPRREVQPLPAQRGGPRSQWVVSEMGFARGRAGVVAPGAGQDFVKPGRRRRWSPTGRDRRGAEDRIGGISGDDRRQAKLFDSSRAGGLDSAHPDDVPDPHVHGMGLHAATYEQLRRATEAMVGLLRAVEDEGPENRA